MPSKSTLTKLKQLVTDYENLTKQLLPLQEQLQQLREQIQSIALKELDANNPKLTIGRILLQFKKGYTTWTWNTKALEGCIVAGHAALAQFRSSKEVAAKELESKGYVHRVLLRGTDGKILGNELPVTKNPATQFKQDLPQAQPG